MKILVVDDEEIIVESLVEIIRGYADFPIAGVLSGPDAVDKAAEMGGVDMLITDVVMDRMDGFALRDALKAKYPVMQTVFVTGYDLSDYEANVAGAAILSKPILSTAILREVHRVWELFENAPKAFVATKPDTVRVSREVNIGETSQQLKAAETSPPRTADLRTLVQKQGFTGQLDQFQLVDIIQMCCMSRRTGRLRVSHGVDSGVIYLKEGNMVHAVVGSEIGEHGVYRIISWDVGQFTFEYGMEATEQTIMVGWEHLVMEGVRRRDESTNGGADLTEVNKSLVGRKLADYQVLRKVGEGEWGEVYEATQSSVNRPVAMKVLRPELVSDGALVQEFVANASAKANVQHPSIISVYEAGQDSGHYFYTREYVDGCTLGDLQAQGAVLDDQTALKVIRVSAEALSYLSQGKVPHTLIAAKSIFLDQEKRPRIANLASLRGDNTLTVQREIQELSRIVSASMQGGVSASQGVRAMLSKMRIDGAGGFLSWGALIQGVKALEPKVIPSDAYKINERDQAAIRAVADAKQRQKRAMILSTVGLFSLFWVVALAFWFKYIRPHATVVNEMIKVEAGDFIYQNGEKKTLPTFWIDKYEVTIADYARFLDALEKNPTTKYDAPNQPIGKSHTPQEWERYYPKAKSGKTYEFAPINLDCPVMNVDWYDAYAYAKWKGHRLPTEMEWEKAARGTKGNIYAWGNEFDTKKLNSSADYNSDPTVKGAIDGYNRFAPVDKHPSDKSEFGIYDMTGNVSEWTSSTEKNMGLDVPIIRGGSFRLPDYELTKRRTDLLAEQAAMSVGFRTVSDTEPQK